MSAKQRNTNEERIKKLLGRKGNSRTVLERKSDGLVRKIQGAWKAARCCERDQRGTLGEED